MVSTVAPVLMAAGVLSSLVTLYLFVRHLSYEKLRKRGVRVQAKCITLASGVSSSEPTVCIGTAGLEFSDWITLSATTGQFQEVNSLTMEDEENVPDLLVTYTGKCDALCFVSSSAAEVDADLTPGGNVLSSGGVGGQPQLRCDTGLYADPASSSTGCVNPQVDPTVEFTLSGTGSTAAIDLWAEENETAAWGYDSPLTRLGSNAQHVANRRAICDDGTFQSLYTNDSCEEYPFASTTQSGGYNGYTGADCAQVQAVNNNGSWYINELSDVTGNEPCVIGHADQTGQNSQGATIKNFYYLNRVIDGDNFYVAIG